jgi:hypothetical protein
MDMSKDEIPSLNIATRISWEIACSEGVELKQLTRVKLLNEDKVFYRKRIESFKCF